MNRLEEVDIIRAISMIFIVLLHSFAIYTGAWEYPGSEGFSIVYPYSILTRMLTSLSLPTFVFISGYLFSYTSCRKQQSLRVLAKDKFQRLIIPSIFFSLLYILIFFEDITLFQKALKLSNGAGHLWFLPMLFWNFILGYFLKKYELKRISYKLLALVALFCIGIIAPLITPNILGVSNAFSYIPYFYMGLELYNYRTVIIENINYKHLITIISLYIVVFVLNEIVLFHLNSMPTSMYIKLYGASYRHLLSIGVIAFFLIVIYYTQSGESGLNDKFNGGGRILNILSSYSFGIYIFHQFILEIMIYDLHIYKYINYRVAPIIYFSIALTISLIFTNLTRRTKIGGFLLK